MPPGYRSTFTIYGTTIGGQGVIAQPPLHPHRSRQHHPAAPTPTGDGTPRTDPRPTAGGYGTTVTGHRPAFTNRTATEPMIRCPACSEAPTMTASALSWSAAFTRPP